MQGLNPLVEGKNEVLLVSGPGVLPCRAGRAQTHQDQVCALWERFSRVARLQNRQLRINRH
jgi:hypothetical protein